MALTIRSTGKRLGPDQEPRLRTLIIGGPGVGKTRWSSFFPKPIYADCEDGTDSIWDRNVPYAEINSSQDMTDLLEALRKECMKPKSERAYQTVVIDTLDAYQRKLKDEWVRTERKPAFTGYDAWGFLQNKMQLLMTRLLNLDMNVIVNVHFKDKVVKEGENERHVYGLQLQGEISDTIFNDFGLVGWMGTYFEAEGGERVQKRGLTFKPTPDKEFLKDRLNITPKWLEVTFSESDYTNLFSLLSEKVDSVEESEELGEIPTATPEVNGKLVVTPEQTATPIPVSTAVEMPLEGLDKPTLQKMARDAGVVIRGNMLKGELITAIREAGKKPEPSPAASTPTEPTKPAETLKGVETVNTETGVIEDAAPLDDVAVTPAPSEPPTHDEAIDTVVDTLGAEVVVDLKPAPAAAPAADTLGPCDDCQKAIPRSEMDYVKISKVKFQPPKPNPVHNGLCKACYQQRKSAA